MSGVTRTCGKEAKGGGLSLPVLAPKPRRSKAGPRRAAVLTLLYVVMIGHFLLWLRYGMTLSPIEPSESMSTLNRGEVNAGFVFFTLAILATLVFGRFVCGWGCHIVALQDLCGWAMKKARIRPKPMRTRLLVLAPLALALYMFVWPTFHREVLTPILSAAIGGVPAWLGDSGPRPEFRNAFMVQDFWATFPPWYIAVPFLAVCGFACVYFLGNKGFCTYGCPYGGFFGVADRFAPGRIIVNEDCEQCGHCTAACTSNVRVHEEVRDFGMVVDPGCMKCLDCVSVCPNHALRFGFTAPAAGSARVKRARHGRRTNYDLTLRAEIVLGILGVALFAGFRGMFDLVPMLMAMGLAGIGVFLAWKLGSMLVTQNVRLQNLQLRRRGRVTALGAVFVPVAALFLAAGVWGAVVQYHLRRALVLDSTVAVPATAYLAAGYTAGPGTASAAAAAIGHLERADAVAEGGYGWSLSPDLLLRLASLRAITGDFSGASRAMQRAIVARRPSDELRAYATQLFVRAGAALVEGNRLPEAVAAYRGASDLNPASGPLRAQYGLALLAAGGTAAGLAAIDDAIRLEPANPQWPLAKAGILDSLGRHEEAADVRRQAGGLGAGQK
ncbi:MAG: 4Fe-4S binding protein [Phycisphaerales bacterium]|nr:4Fe-4S binding protein [Phycisphaerales bacterium]